jgi:ketosteroid isomerase-like protein
MSSDNVEIVRRIYDAVARRDDETPFELYAEDIVWDYSNLRTAGLMSQHVYRGHEGVRQAWRDGVLSVFKDVHIGLEELKDGDENHVLAVVRERHLGRSSGVPVETVHYAVWTLARGKVTHLRMFDDPQQAVEAAGAPD